MTKKIFKSIFTASLIALLLCFIITTGILYGYFTSVQKDRLQTELSISMTAVEQSGKEYLEKVDTDGYRFTWISSDGSVIYDTETDAENMENHLDREEVKQAFANGFGESSRYSDTLTERTIYYARLLDDGTVLRISVKNATVLSLVLGMVQPLFFLIVILLILCGIIASHMSKRVVAPLNNLDLEHPLESSAYDELSPLLRKINQLHGQINMQVRELRRKKDEFDQITGSMSEGLVVLDDRGIIVSINNSAKRIFNSDESCVGTDFLTIERNPEVSETIQKAVTDGHGEMYAEKSGREYQFEISRIESGGNIIGIVLLAFDITEKVFAERNRREFTANVSHELKTPLQSILGSAELIENGFVKSEDLPGFAGRIRTEATRLVALIDDIIRLSQLDEKVNMEFENTDLFEIASETVGELKYLAETKNVTVNLTGEKTTVKGVHKLLSEIVFNLCDNAIKYNKDGGSVDISVTHDDKNAVLTVSDNGIGIPLEHQSRIFERFYRVDKSHSKKSGGTGLGLSIVKHAAELHKGHIELNSSEGKGTEFKVILPLN